MKKNLGTFILASRWGVGAVLMAFCAFTPVSRADVIVDNTGATTFTHLSGAPVAQVFTMPGYSGDISSLTLELYSAAGELRMLTFTMYREVCQLVRRLCLEPLLPESVINKSSL